jgi:putative transposase
MANTYTQLHIHAVFVVKYRQSLIKPAWKNRLYEYLGGILNTHGHKPLNINGTDDHVHMLFGLQPNQSISDLMQDVKGGSSKWINENRFSAARFQWQGGYGAFAVCKNRFKIIANYIERQEEHHRSKSFGEEYLEILRENEVDYDERYLFSDLI